MLRPVPSQHRGGGGCLVFGGPGALHRRAESRPCMLGRSHARRCVCCALAQGGGSGVAVARARSRCHSCHGPRLPPPAREQVHPSNHPKLFGRAPNESNTSDERAALYAKYGRVDGAPAAGHGHH